jgi:5-methylcytosine-specific restriction endonuclease McrA
MNCLQCKSETKNPKFCSRSCSATYNNNIGLYKRREPEGKCKECQIPIPSSRRYCQDHKFDKNSNRRRKIGSWINGSWRGGTDSGLSKIVRDYLLDQANYSCQRCGFDTPHPDDNKTILEVNHINGDGTDHSPNNLEVICPNCHALTSNYRGRNVGNGRPVYYLRRFI